MLRKAVDPGHIGQVLKALVGELKGHRKELRLWIKGALAGEFGYQLTNTRHKHLKNAVGKSISLPLTMKAVERKRKAASHLLTGLEALFIHTLTTLAPTYGFEVLANEHDGLITRGIIPEEAMEEARARTGLLGLRLAEKPFKRLVLSSPHHNVHGKAC